MQLPRRSNGVVICGLIVDQNSFKTIADLLNVASSVLEDAEIPNSRREASGLLEFATGLTRTAIIAHPEALIDSSVERRFLGILERRRKREPFHYITGSKEFFGLDFLVDRRVLIPRPETELLVEKGLSKLKELEDSIFCEIGVGSGCVSISILKNHKGARGIGLDISNDALKVAMGNAERHGVYERLELIESDLFSGLEKGILFDAIISNPPYVSSKDLEGLEPEVRDFEPRKALTDGDSGLGLIRKIISDSPYFLKDDGLIAIEIGFDQRHAVEGMFTDTLWKDVGFVRDLQGHERIVFATRRARSASN